MQINYFITRTYTWNQTKTRVPGYGLFRIALGILSNLWSLVQIFSSLLNSGKREGRIEKGILPAHFSSSVLVLLLQRSKPSSPITVLMSDNAMDKVDISVEFKLKVCALLCEHLHVCVVVCVNVYVYMCAHCIPCSTMQLIVYRQC